MVTLLETLELLESRAAGCHLHARKTALSSTFTKKVPNEFLVTLMVETHERVVRKRDAGCPRVDTDVCHEHETSPTGGATAMESHHEAHSVYTFTSFQKGQRIFIIVINIKIAVIVFFLIIA